MLHSFLTFYEHSLTGRLNDPGQDVFSLGGDYSLGDLGLQVGVSFHVGLE